MRLVTTVTVKGKPEKMTLDGSGKWLSADCGAVKPMNSPHGRSLRVAPEALQAAARETLRLCRLSKAAQAALEPQAPAPRGRCACGLAEPDPRPLLEREIPTVA
ncbi:hypothetical protein GCM10011496_34810 [Polaromonas eurypsychrophila]|uniref:Uncharacterized protein n=1 Tax=Polaromonas eurypsychrophila TaxID=1614635 RepID=A0A916SS61_9BURK|nr:hypothetical protein GCM10011496_34810 [Polaromonas eurypsychrophila]